MISVIKRLLRDKFVRIKLFIFMKIFNPIKGPQKEFIKWIFHIIWNLLLGNKEFEFAWHGEDLFNNLCKYMLYGLIANKPDR